MRVPSRASPRCSPPSIAATSSKAAASRSPACPQAAEKGPSASLARPAAPAQRTESTPRGAAGRAASHLDLFEPPASFPRAACDSGPEELREGRVDVGEVVEEEI